MLQKNMLTYVYDIQISDSLAWSNQAVLLLISLKKEKSDLFTSNVITPKQAWNKLSEEMCEKGHHVTGDDCSRKFRSLKNRSQNR